MYSEEEVDYFSFICDTCLECCADVETRIQDLNQERMGFLSQGPSKSTRSKMVAELHGIIKTMPGQTRKKLEVKKNS